MPALRPLAAALGAAACLTAVAVTGVVVTGGSAHATTATAAAAPVAPKVPVQGCCEKTRLVPGEQLLASTSTETSWLTATGLPPAAPAGSVYGQTETGLSLTLQPDGNLVEYLDTPGSPTRAVWSTGTRTATRLVFQSDRNVVLRDAAGRALWSTGTAGSAAAYFSPYGNGQVVTQDSAGRVLTSTGPSLTALPGVVVQGAASVGRSVTLDVQPDGNLVAYDVRDRSHLRALWSSRTSGAGAVRLFAQSDGNLVLRQLSTGRAVWASGSHGPTGYFQLDAQNDGNVVLYRTDGTRRLAAVWSTRTHV